MQDKFLASEYPQSAPEQAGFHIIPVPLEQSVSYGGGTVKGPQALLAASHQLEAWECGFAPGESGFFTAQAVDCAGPITETLDRIEAAVAHAIACEAVPVVLGGEHTVTLGALRALARPAEKTGEPFGVVQFDAHADLRDDYLGVKLSHACVLRRCWELTGDGKIYQFGIRSGDRQEWRWGKDHVSTHRFDLDGLEETLDRLGDTPLYFTLDLDVLDPSVFPGTGTPEPGGVSFDALRKAVTLVCEKANVIACDVNELSPPCDQSGVSTMAACKIVREMLLALK